MLQYNYGSQVSLQSFSHSRLTYGLFKNGVSK